MAFMSDKAQAFHLISWIFVSFLFSYHCCNILNFLTFLNISWISWFISLILVIVATFAFRNHKKIYIKDLAVLITGCDHGFGFLLAQKLQTMGFVVFAGCKDVESDGSKKLADSKIHVIQLDVTSQNQMDNAVHYIVNKCKDVSLWAVVNNAGISTFGYTEWTSIEDYKQLAEVNLFGVIRVTKACLPLIRKSKGRIVNISSLLGLRSAASRGPYSITKYGIETFSDTLRLEMRHFGVDVCLIEPGNYVSETNILMKDYIKNHSQSMWNHHMSGEARSAYSNIFHQTVQNTLKFSGSGTCDVNEVLDAMVAAITDAYPLPRYQPTCWYYKAAVMVSLHCPEFVYELLFS